MPQTPMAHLLAELQRLDLLLHREILCLRARYQLSLDEFRGLYISDEQVNQLIDQALGRDNAESAVDELTRRAEELHRQNTERFSSALPWYRLAEDFGLSPLEHDLILLAVAPEIDPKYETVYAYLNNDITRKWPTCDLALRLLATNEEERLAVRSALLSQASLFSQGLLNPIQPAPERPSWLTSGFSLAPSVSHHLLGLPFSHPGLASFVERRIPTIGWDEVPLSDDLGGSLRRILNLFQPSFSNRPAPMLIFEGRDGSGRALAAEALCRDLEISLLHVDMQALRGSFEPVSKLTQAVVLQQRLQQAGVYIQHAEALFDKEGNLLPETHGIVRQLAQLKGPVFFACEPEIHWHELMKGQRWLAFHFHDPDFNQRLELWQRCLQLENIEVASETCPTLANRFTLTPGQIKDAVAAAMDTRRLLNGQAPQDYSADSLLAAARTQSDQSLGRLAVKVSTIHTWNELVLPAATLRQIKDIAAAIQYRHVVYSEWGFARRIASGIGLKVLFAGASGTGKTMTAGVIARDLGLDLYKIDLSSVVSKYIGETEKNLDRIFRAAHCSNAILFFDEADALFGKRSEVKDAHDRYANIEVAYLLQKMEEHEGAVILASNLSRNIDQAFSRRMHYVVEFPLPDEKHREQLWRGMFPSQAPIGKDVDFGFLARQFAIPGGDIKNVALDAAFLAAQDGRVVTMKQLSKAMARQMIKQGKIPSPTDFKQYHALIEEDR